MMELHDQLMPLHVAIFAEPGLVARNTACRVWANAVKRCACRLSV